MALARAVATQPFTLAHFHAWAAKLRTDDLEPLGIEPFQDRIIEDVFAGYKEIWVIIPEENGKTTLVSALALYHAEHRTMASVLVAASSREQGEVLYKQAEGFVIRSPRMHQVMRSTLQRIKGKRKLDVPRFECLEGYRRINHYQGGRIQVFAADDRTGDGQLPTLGILEELHRHRNLALYRTWTGKLRKRNGQIIAISTSGEPGSDFELTRERIRQTATEIHREPGYARFVVGSVVLHEYAVPEDGDVTDMQLVKAANPFSRVTVESLSAKFNSPTTTLSHWRRFVCNLPTRSDSAAITEAEWEAARDPEGIPPGTPVWVGLDVAWKWDTTAAVPFWMRDNEHRVLGPAEILKPPRDGNMLHPDEVKRALLRIHERTPIHTVVMDVIFAQDIAAWLRDELSIEVIERGQSHPLAIEEYETFMEALRNGWLRHSGDEGLTRHVLNAMARMLPSGARIFERPSDVRISSQQDRRVIDALKAAAMVHAQATATAEQPSAYEERGLVLI
ncbi:MAG TPA: terminase large subunit [candidate division Zixibacteria bacterium]|nr:terminase large subunit [candidate division Zixibacteria bacterium]